MGWDRYRLGQIAVEVLAQACLNCPMDVHVFPSIALRVSSCHQENGNFALCHAECEYRGRKIGVGGLNHFEPRITSTSRWRPSSGPLVPRDFFKQNLQDARNAIMLENVGALLSSQKNCRILFRYILKATVRRKPAELHRNLCISKFLSVRPRSTSFSMSCCQEARKRKMKVHWASLCLVNLTQNANSGSSRAKDHQVQGELPRDWEGQGQTSE